LWWCHYYYHHQHHQHYYNYHYYFVLYASYKREEVFRIDGVVHHEGADHQLASLVRPEKNTVFSESLKSLSDWLLLLVDAAGTSLHCVVIMFSYLCL